MSVEGTASDELAGWIRKKEATDNDWIKRFCIVVEKSITLYENEKCEKIDKHIPISSSSSVDPLLGPSGPGFILTLSDGGFFLFQLDTIEQSQKWIDGIRRACSSTHHLKIDEFNILKTIGRGSFAKVKLCQHKVTGQLFAIKVIHKRKLLDRKLLHTVVTEKEILMKTSNPFIVKIFFTFQSTSKFYLGLEYIPGGEMFYYMQQHGPLKPDEVRFYSSEIAYALNYLHSNGLIYRDLKPENIMFDEAGHIKLTDFGLSAEEKEANIVCGTASYISPEMVLELSYNNKIDWWSLGVLMYEMATNMSPFVGGQGSTVYNSIVNTDPDFPPNIDPDLYEVISALLTKNPSKRPGFEEIKKFKFFETIDWDKIKDREYQPPYVPDIQDKLKEIGDGTNELVADSLIPAESAEIPNFSFVGVSFPSDEYIGDSPSTFNDDNYY